MILAMVFRNGSSGNRNWCQGVSDRFVDILQPTFDQRLKVVSILREQPLPGVRDK